MVGVKIEFSVKCGLKFLRAHPMDQSSRSMVEYLTSGLHNVREAYEIGRSLPLDPCERTEL